MKDSKHTPGPWKHEEAIGTDDVVLFYLVNASAGHGVASVYPNDYPLDGKKITVEQAEANARLIAAAPGMLEALEYTAGIIQGNDDLDALEPWAQDVLGRIREAVAKAKGQK